MDRSLSQKRVVADRDPKLDEVLAPKLERSSTLTRLFELRATRAERLAQRRK
jgi:hypothetical protein